LYIDVYRYLTIIIFNLINHAAYKTLLLRYKIVTKFFDFCDSLCLKATIM